ncbi:VanZ family protein [Psychroserpens ponticola]|uniref:VanZ family protein n=1 Tax=Psychroserpens ponticola TaxID=2932268 RepID=A0ABY7S3E5_9FLAO|nr:VanZ family protein [Psychroserpens ponticola]WCO03709.1 VanZ family protein [Psychroserpens ponticola]
MLVYIIALTYGSLGNISGVPKLGFTFDDKIYHLLAYAILTFLLFNYIRTTQVKKAILLSASIAFVYGIIIEVLQSTLTDFRTPDYYDVLANTIGVVFIMLLLRFKTKLKLK